MTSKTGGGKGKTHGLPGARQEQGEGKTSFADAMDQQSVQPLEGRDRLATPDRSTRRAGRGAAKTAPSAAAGEGRRVPRFIHPDASQALAAYASGVQRAVLNQLRKGKPAPSSRIDLHGLRAHAARKALRRAVAAAVADGGGRCLLVVHGRGVHSPDEPVLKTQLPGWLSEPGVAEHLAAFSPSRAADGGEGATYLLIRRPPSARHERGDRAILSD